MTDEQAAALEAAIDIGYAIGALSNSSGKSSRIINSIFAQVKEWYKTQEQISASAANLIPFCSFCGYRMVKYTPKRYRIVAHSDAGIDQYVEDANGPWVRAFDMGLEVIEQEYLVPPPPTPQSTQVTLHEGTKPK